VIAALEASFLLLLWSSGCGIRGGLMVPPELGARARSL